jgi:hypothetical protein
MTMSAAQASTFYRDATLSGLVWTLRDADGIPAPANGSGQRAMPFWSARSRVERVISNVAAYDGFEPVEVRLEDFTARWLPGLQRDGLLVGLNWSGTRATGYDVTPAEVARALEAQSIELPEA